MNEGDRAAIDGVIRLLAASLGLAADVVEDALASVGEPRLAPSESADTRYVVDALRRVGQLAIAQDLRFGGDAFLSSMLRGEPLAAPGLQLAVCEDADTRKMLQFGVPIASSQDATLLMCKRSEVWETARRGKPVRHASMLAWLTTAARTIHLV